MLNSFYQKIIVFSISTVLLFCSFQWNLFHIADHKQFTEFQRDSESLVLGSIMEIRNHGLFSQAGLLGRVDAELELWNEATEQQYAYLANETVGTTYVHYISQSGGQGVLYAAIDHIIFWLEPLQRLEALHAVNSLLSALVLSAFIVWILGEFGLYTALFVSACILLSADITLFGRNLYWVIWILYAPMVIGFFILGSQRFIDLSMRRKIVWLFIFYTSTIIVKYVLSGFEYIFAFLAMTAIPLVYYAFRDRWDWQLLAGGVGVFLLSVAVSTPLAYLLVSAQIAWSEQISLWTGIDLLFQRYELHTGIITVDTMSGAEIVVRYLMHTPFSRIFGLQIINIAYSISFVIAVMIFLQLRLFLHPQTVTKKQRRKMDALSATTILSLLGPISFFVIFKVHAQIHGHIDFIAWYFPFLLFVFIVVGNSLELALHRLGLLHTLDN